ncbi:type II toxin-antitoxin system Y4mF family antitoxin [Sporichthya sp.]|uniref:type II toxin-antitoxin system Y4mF family antitoxin n=1 Tax=Sporichthya sp. TaxID=65475 RepID=UPI0017D8044B|nr:type II toxin-antitoxin system Y4mF family antitoxin [Sporichthya sp.]MBA3741888.1 helix-turn-helix transcriptional regulator [Sporichthya sp.]
MNAVLGTEDRAGRAGVIRLRRTTLGLRQGDLADLAGVSERFIHAMENGKTTVRLDKVIAVITTLGLHLELHPGSGASLKKI